MLVLFAREMKVQEHQTRHCLECNGYGLIEIFHRRNIQCLLNQLQRVHQRDSTLHGMRRSDHISQDRTLWKFPS